MYHHPAQLKKEVDIRRKEKKEIQKYRYGSQAISSTTVKY
jgi:hypothetical protein